MAKINCLSFTCLFAQTLEIKGKISDKTTKDPLIGAAIEVKGKGTGTVADLDGQFVLSGVAATDKLIVTYLGYAKQEIPVGSKKYFDILMSEDAVYFDFFFVEENVISNLKYAY